jgi:hypothetical protein
MGKGDCLSCLQLVSMLLQRLARLVLTDRDPLSRLVRQLAGKRCLTIDQVLDNLLLLNSKSVPGLQINLCQHNP